MPTLTTFRARRRIAGSSTYMFYIIYVPLDIVSYLMIIFHTAMMYSDCHEHNVETHVYILIALRGEGKRLVALAGEAR